MNNAGSFFAMSRTCAWRVAIRPCTARRSPKSPRNTEFLWMTQRAAKEGWDAYYATRPEKLKAKLERAARKGKVKRGRPSKEKLSRLRCLTDTSICYKINV